MPSSSAIYPQIAFGISTDMPELFKRHLTRNMPQDRHMSVASLKL